MPDIAFPSNKLTTLNNTAFSGSGGGGAASGNVSVSNFPAIQTISGSIDVANITQPLTDTQLRATPVPVSGSVAVSNITQPLTDTQLRANPVLVAADDLPLPTGAAREATVNALIGVVQQVLEELSNKPNVADTILTNEVDNAFLERVALKALSRLTFTTTGSRVDCGGTNVTASIAASQTLATVTTVSSVASSTNVAMGRTTADGQGIQMSQINFNHGFRRNLTFS